jgi:hypothetical protein
MKALNKLDSVAKGQLFAGLFPDEIQGLVDAIKGVHDYMKGNEAAIRESGEGVVFNAEFWFRLVTDVGNAIEQYGSRLAKNKRLFADQLFDGYNALFTVECIIKYKYKTGNPKFVQAITLLFE